jgi:hypothetical protein
MSWSNVSEETPPNPGALDPYHNDIQRAYTQGQSKVKIQMLLKEKYNIDTSLHSLRIQMHIWGLLSQETLEGVDDSFAPQGTATAASQYPVSALALKSASKLIHSRTLLPDLQTNMVLWAWMPANVSTKTAITSSMVLRMALSITHTPIPHLIGLACGEHNQAWNTSYHLATHNWHLREIELKPLHSI